MPRASGRCGNHGRRGAAAFLARRGAAAFRGRRRAPRPRRPAPRAPRPLGGTCAPPASRRRA
eukprot:4513091-Prymnesium_polylepis.1